LPPEPDAAQITSARWFGGKGAAVTSVREDDRLELGGGGSLRILTVTTDDGARDRYLWVDGEVGRSLVELTTRGGERGRFRFAAGSGLVGVEPRSSERPIGIDQSNTSIVVGERLVVKLYRRLHRGVHPEIELGAHLTSAGVEFVPAFAGSVHWDGHPIAMLQAFVPGAQDGWSWAAEAVMAGDVSDLGELGARTAELHAALALRESRVATDSELSGWRDTALAQLERAAALVGGEARELLARHRPQLLAELAWLADPDPPAQLTPVHGDYHIGQILKSPGGALAVVDLEGEPTKTLAERAALSSPLRDVAAMLRSFDHLARYVDRDRWPGHAAQIEAWIVAARDAFLDGYGPVDSRRLRALEVEKECYEFVYAATFLPDWTYAAVGGMRWLLENDGG
jgi:predicted trehalose synthase